MTKIKYKHFDIETREELCSLLNDGFRVSEIASKLGKDKSTISKEIKKHRTEHRSSGNFNSAKYCVHLTDCSKTNLCPNINCDNKLCKRCNHCFSVCPDYELGICKRLTRAPHVCNGCKTRRYCHKPIKFFYTPSQAQKEYEDTLVNSRTGINITEDELNKIDSIVSPLITKQSQSLNHIFATHVEEISVSQSTIYNYIDNGYLECSNIDLPRRVRFKKENKIIVIKRRKLTNLR